MKEHANSDMRKVQEPLPSSLSSDQSFEKVDQEARAKLRRYFDLAWRIFERLESEGAIDGVNLTTLEVNPTVKPSKPSHH